MHVALGDNEQGTMIGYPRNVHDHLKDVAEADDLLKQHVYFPLKEICRIEVINIIVQQQMLASALQEMRQDRYVSVLADEVTSKKTRRKEYPAVLLQRTDVLTLLAKYGIIYVSSAQRAYMWIFISS